jgi:hypothetical protein
MLQIDHVYEFLYQEIFKDFDFWYLKDGVPKLDHVNIFDVSVFTPIHTPIAKIFFYDQEPFITTIANPYVDLFTVYDFTSVLVTSEYSNTTTQYSQKNNFYNFYYFFHGFAALDWYRGFYALNYSKSIVKQYKYDYVSFNRIVTNDRSYRIYFVSLLKQQGLLDYGQVSFNVTDQQFDNWRDEISNLNSKLSICAKLHAKEHLDNINKLVIDNQYLPGSASASIPRTINRRDYNNDTPNYDSFWHIVTETVFYYKKLHLTEKIFKPIVSKQPFMLLAAPGNLAYLKSYGFKTFDGIIDESYDLIEDNDKRVEAVVAQLNWYCNLSTEGKQQVIEDIAPIVEYNFHHFYGEFKHIIAIELINNTKTLFQQIKYNDNYINYDSIYHTITN